MVLLWIIYDQKKIEKQAKAEGWKPACSMMDRLTAYFFCILLPLVVGIVISR